MFVEKITPNHDVQHKQIDFIILVRVYYTLIWVENIFMIVSSLIFACPIIKFFPKLDVYLRILNIVPKPASAMK